MQSFDLQGNFRHSWSSEFGNSLAHPSASACDGKCVADTDNNRVFLFHCVDIEPGTRCTAIAIPPLGSEGSGELQFERPSGIAKGSDSNLFVADTLNSRVQEVNQNGSLIAEWGSYGSGNGQFNSPFGIAVDSSTGNVFVVDTNNHRIEVFANACMPYVVCLPYVGGVGRH